MYKIFDTNCGFHSIACCVAITSSFGTLSEQGFGEIKTIMNFAKSC